MSPIEEYHRAIETGEAIVGEKVKRVYARLVDEMENPGQWHYDDSRARKAIDFCQKYCRQSKAPWAGKPLRLLLWERALVAAIFGFVDDNGLRRYTEVFLTVGRKNGKSSLAAAIILYMSLTERGSEAYIASTKLDQSYHLYDEIDAMIAQSPPLRRRCRRRRSDIYQERTRGTIRPLGSKSSSLDGLNASCIVADELHAWRGESGRKLYNVLRESMSAREQPLFLVTSTAGFEAEGPYSDLYSLAEHVIDGSMTQDRFLPICYELDADDEWLDEGMWPKANPSLGEVKRIDDLRERCSRARQTGDVANILTKDFNRRQNASTAWISFSEAVSEPLDLSLLRGRYGIAGVDLSASGDLTSAGILVPRDGRWLWHTMSWLPSDLLEEHERKDDVPYRQWQRRGLLRTCEGNKIDYHDVTKWLMDCVRDLGVSIMWCGYDSWSAQYWVDEVSQTGMRMRPVIQGARTLSTPMQDLRLELRAHNVVFGDNPLMTWALTNVRELRDANENVRPIKERPGMRIDPAMALLDAWTVALEHRDEILSLNGEKV